MGVEATPLELPDYIPLSMLNQLEYCERRFWLMFVQGEMDVNAPVLEGTLQHERVHRSGSEVKREGGEEEGGLTLHQRVYLWSARLRVAGYADLVECRHETAREDSAERGCELYPVEHKHGRLGRWLNDHIQLCAQALCLEERTGLAVTRGAIFYWGSRRRVEVALTPELRARTEAAIARALALLSAGRIPPPLDHWAKCRDCSLEGICLPREVELLNAEAQGVRSKERA